MSQHGRAGSSIPPASTAHPIIPRKRTLSASAIPLRPPPNLRTSAATTPQPPVPEDEDDEGDGKDDYGDIEVNNGESRDEALKEERERLKYTFPDSCLLYLLGGRLTLSRVLLETFTPEQMSRYEVFRRANLNKGSIKKVTTRSPAHYHPPGILSLVVFRFVVSGGAHLLAGKPNPRSICPAKHCNCNCWFRESICR